MALPKIQTLWIGGELSTLEQLSLQSFVDNGHRVHLYTYEEVAGVPEEVSVKDGSEILSADNIFTYNEYDSPSGFSNVFRYKLLLEKGGFWVDTDVVCLRPFDFGDKHIFVSERSRPRKRSDLFPRTRIASCVIKAPAGSNTLEYCYDVATEKNWDQIDWGEIGPDLVARAVNHFQMNDKVLPYWKFCPVDWWEWDRFVEDSVQIRVWEAVKRAVLRPYAYHLWNELWRRNGVPKDESYTEGTIYERLKAEHLE